MATNTMSHIGTHAEAPSHFIPALPEGKDAPDIADFPPDAWWGEAVFINLAKLPAKAKVTPELLKQKGVKKGDIVVIGNSPYKDDDKIAMTDAAAKYRPTWELNCGQTSPIASRKFLRTRQDEGSWT
jgi:kynurenine formamidase